MRAKSLRLLTKRHQNASLRDRVVRGVRGVLNGVDRMLKGCEVC